MLRDQVDMHIPYPHVTEHGLHCDHCVTLHVCGPGVAVLLVLCVVYSEVELIRYVTYAHRINNSTRFV
jgi:hypothetical protein